MTSSMLQFCFSMYIILIHLELIFVHGVKKEYNYFFPSGDIFWKLSLKKSIISNWFEYYIYYILILMCTQVVFGLYVLYYTPFCILLFVFYSCANTILFISLYLNNKCYDIWWGVRLHSSLIFVNDNFFS